MSLFSFKLTTKGLYDKWFSSVKFLVGNGHHDPCNSDLDHWLLHSGQVSPVTNATGSLSAKQEPLNLAISPLLKTVVPPPRPIAPLPRSTPLSKPASSSPISIPTSELPTTNPSDSKDLLCPPAAPTKQDFPGSFSMPTMSQPTTKGPSVIDNKNSPESRPTKKRRIVENLPDNEFRRVTRSQTKQMRAQDTVQASSASSRAVAAKRSSKSKRLKKNKARSRSATLTAEREPQDILVSPAGQRPSTTTSIYEDKTTISIAKISPTPPSESVSASFPSNAANQEAHTLHLAPSSSSNARVGPERISTKKRPASAIDNDDAVWSRPPSPLPAVPGSPERTAQELSLPSARGLESLSERNQGKWPISAINNDDADWSRSPSPPSTVACSRHWTTSELSLLGAQGGLGSPSEMEQDKRSIGALDINNGEWLNLPSPSLTVASPPARSAPEPISPSATACLRCLSEKVLGKRRAIDIDDNDDEGYASLDSPSPSGVTGYAQATGSTQSRGGYHSRGSLMDQKSTSEKEMAIYKQPFKSIELSTLGDDDNLDLDHDDSNDDDDDDDEMSSFFDDAATATAERVSSNSKFDIWTQHRSQSTSPRVKYVSEKAWGKQRAISTDANNEGRNLAVPTRATVNTAQLHVLDQRLPQLQARPPLIRTGTESSWGTVLGKRPAVAADGDGSGRKSGAEDHPRKKARTTTTGIQRLGPADTRKEVLENIILRRKIREAEYALATAAEFNRLFCTSGDKQSSCHRQGAQREALSSLSLALAGARGVTQDQRNSNDRWLYLCQVVQDDHLGGHFYSSPPPVSLFSQQTDIMTTLVKLGRKWKTYAKFISWGPKPPKVDKNRRAQMAAQRRIVLHKSLVNLFIDKQSSKLLPFVDERARREYFRFRLRNTDAYNDWQMSMEAVSKMSRVADAEIDRKPS